LTKLKSSITMLVGTLCERPRRGVFFCCL